jgi:hypothetical protein
MSRIDYFGLDPDGILMTKYERADKEGRKKRQNEIDERNTLRQRLLTVLSAMNSLHSEEEEIQVLAQSGWSLDPIVIERARKIRTEREAIRLKEEKLKLLEAQEIQKVYDTLIWKYSKQAKYLTIKQNRAEALRVLDGSTLPEEEKLLEQLNEGAAGYFSHGDIGEQHRLNAIIFLQQHLEKRKINDKKHGLFKK